MRNLIVRLIVAWARAHALPTAESIVVDAPAKPVDTRAKALA